MSIKSYRIVLCWGGPIHEKPRHTKILQMKGGGQLAFEAGPHTYCQCQTWPNEFQFPRPPVCKSLHTYKRWNNFVTKHATPWQRGLPDFRQHPFLRKSHILAKLHLIACSHILDPLGQCLKKYMLCLRTTDGIQADSRKCWVLICCIIVH